MGQVFGGRYELVDAIGHGGSGSVWRVWDSRESSFRAAKLLTQSDSVSLLRFIRETGRRVIHRHVLPPTGWIGEDDRVLLLMDLVTGGSLQTLLADYGPLPDWFAMVVTDQLLNAQETIHDNGLIHRDIKPGNLLFESTGTAMPVVRLADFGIAVRIDDARLTHTTEVVGTHGYLSPLARMGVEPDPGQDLYATAMVLGQMLTGVRPTETDQPIDLREAPADLSRFVRRLAADSGHGFSSATQARTALRELTATTNPGTDPIEVFDQVGPLPPGWDENGKESPPQPRGPHTEQLRDLAVGADALPTEAPGNSPLPSEEQGAHAAMVTSRRGRALPIALGAAGLFMLVAGGVLLFS